MKSTKLPRLFYSLNQETVTRISGLGFNAYHARLISTGAYADFECVAVEDQPGGAVFQKLVAAGIPAADVLFVQDHPGLSAEDLTIPADGFSFDTALAQTISDGPDFPTYNCGIPYLDPCLKWRLPELVVMAGPYGQGKSLLAQFLGTRFIATNGKNLDCEALFCSFEDMNSQIRRDVTIHAASHGLDPDLLLKRIRVLTRPAKLPRTLEWFSGLVYNHVEKHNTRFVILDPWNEVDHERDMRQSETDYVREAMRHFRAVVDDLKIILVIVTHVGSAMIDPEGKIRPFKIAQSFGSSMFGAKADRGMCVARTRTLGGDHMILAMDKVKIERLMGRRDVCALSYDWQAHTMRYDVQASSKLREDWKL